MTIEQQQLELPTIARGDHKKDFHQLTPPMLVWGYGTCLRCGATNQDLGNGLCLQCYDDLCNHTHMYYRRKFLGLCVYCGAALDNGRVSCPKCLSQATTRRRLSRLKKKLYPEDPGG